MNNQTKRDLFDMLDMSSGRQRRHASHREDWAVKWLASTAIVVALLALCVSVAAFLT